MPIWQFQLYFGMYQVNVMQIMKKFSLTCTQTNTVQAVLATDGVRSYAIYTYECGKLNWRFYNAGIGFSASPSFYAEHPLSRNSSVNEIACINRNSTPSSNWSNVVYQISRNGQYKLVPIVACNCMRNLLSKCNQQITRVLMNTYPCAELRSTQLVHDQSTPALLQQLVHRQLLIQCSTRREGIIVCLTFCLISLESFVLEL